MKACLAGGIGLVALSLGLPAWALDDLRFVVSGGGEDLEDDLRNASLLVAAQNEDVTDPTELLAAARADYGRLVGALYSTGRYGPVINIFIDGQEAAALSPLTRLERIGTITVNVEAGPVYPFSQTELGPLAPDTEIPDGFTVGEPAESGTIRDAARNAVEGWREANAPLVGSRAEM